MSKEPENFELILRDIDSGVECVLKEVTSEMISNTEGMGKVLKQLMMKIVLHLKEEEIKG